MSAQLSLYKRLLTQHCTKLETVLSRSKQSMLETETTSGKEQAPGYERDCIKKLQEALGAIESCTSRIERVWQEYAHAVDAKSDASKPERDDFESYATKAESILSSALDFTTTLQGRLRSLTTIVGVGGSSYRVGELPSKEPGEFKSIALPTIPIPIFTGKIWEWDNFWTLFNANVHTQPIPPLIKFNHLLSALKGDPYHAVKKFQVTDENYQKAVDFLSAKYGRKEELVNHLVSRLEKIAARSPAAKDQRVLLEQLQVIVYQLRDKGEPIDSPWLIKHVLSKFSDKLQRAVLAKKDPIEGAFGMETLLSSLDQIIFTEEKITLYTSENSESPSTYRKKDKQQNNQLWHGAKLCMYCSGNHRSFTCTKYETPQQRANYLREHKLCFICASPHHPTSDCKKRVCFVCQGKHHTSCCFKGSTSTKAAAQNERQPVTPFKSEQKEARYRKSNNTVTATHQLSRENNLENSHADHMDILASHFHAKEGQPENEQTFLPIGELTVMNSTTRSLKKVAVLLDSGAECSFIDCKLAEELDLPTLSTTILRLRTFGSDRVQEHSSRKVSLEVWDEKGESFSLKLLTHDSLTSSLRTPPLLNEDIAYIRSINLQINLTKRNACTKPLILIGCDQIWQLVRQNETYICLPSGLYLLPTRLGHLFTGQIERARQLTQTDEQEECWALNKPGPKVTCVNAFSFEDFSEAKDEKSLLEKYWSMEQEGTGEFVQQEREVQSLVDQKVMEGFLNTVEKKNDGYYVRLPWKEIHTTLPDNRAIALRRLISTWNTLQRDQELLEEYNNTFKEQHRLGIIEEVEDENASVEGTVHYLPHQAVLTPQKNTTKLRIVFDASAHFKNCPSLNDALHRGPVLLPKLYGLLLRFRIGRIALVSDVEKAYLQVRLHQADRDATCCFWLRNHKNPPCATNLKIFRFTRVTFGLLPSPFLLAATIRYHLDNYSKDISLVREIKENLYVDNLILTSDTPNEGTRVYMKTKEIFNELRMNLREFASNDQKVMEKIPQVDKSTAIDLKILGIKWHSSEDMLEISCSVAEQKEITKRTVASTIASLYDPMGWILPLVHRAKIFLQRLWKEGFDWDTPLTPDDKRKWECITESIQGFRKLMPRFLSLKFTKVHLVTCADASSEAYAACTYLRSTKTADLVMAKGKLSSLKTKSTIPKLELNAVTLAMRLTNSVVSQISTVVSIGRIIVLTDSEVVLNWIKSEPRHSLSPFIKNRVTEIHRITRYLQEAGYLVQFGHLSSQDNPADCATRGLDKTLLSDHFWWTGPKFLTQEVDTWTNAFKPVITEWSQKDENEPQDGSNITMITRAASVNHSQQKIIYTDIFHEIKYSKFSTVRRVVAYVLRFIQRTLDRVMKKQGVIITLSPLFHSRVLTEAPSLTGTEIKRASDAIAKQHQLSHLKPAVLKSLHHLNPFTDEYGIFRCRGRMGKSDLDESTKFPILILQKTWLSKLIIVHCHNALHTSIGHTMSRVREHYWIPKLRAEVTSIVRKCVVCQKMNNLPYKYPEQGHLPKRRVTRSRPFEHVGLDYFGPLSVKDEESGHVSKCYGSIITCLVTRLVHLDLVADVSTIAFIHMLRRFFARRGVPRTITSDNAPTFALGDSILKESVQRARDDPAVAKEISNRQIDWIYNTPYAPWQGGVYERLIQSVKLVMHKVLGKSTPTREELVTLIVEIEGMLNTRPLLYVETEPDRVLRPIDFLQNEFEVHPPMNEANSCTEDPTYLTPAEKLATQTKLQAQQAIASSYQLTEKFWQIWQSQYLTSLREKHQREIGKKRGSRIVPKKGQMLLICDELQPRHMWKMGRVEELVKNSEGEAREAIVRLPSRRKIRRPLNLLVPLEFDDDESESVQFDDDGSNPTMEPSPHESNTLLEEEAQERDQQERSTKYNLRPQKAISYTGFIKNASSHVVMILIVVLGIVCNMASGLTNTKPCVYKGHNYCSQGSAKLAGVKRCLGKDYKRNVSQHVLEEIRLPNHRVLTERNMQGKFLGYKIRESQCPSAGHVANNCMQLHRAPELTIFGIRTTKHKLLGASNAFALIIRNILHLFAYASPFQGMIFREALSKLCKQISIKIHIRITSQVQSRLDRQFFQGYTIYTNAYYRMSANLDEASYLSRILHNRRQDWKLVRTDLDDIHDSLEQRLKIASSLHRQWIHTRNDSGFISSSPASRMSVVTQRMSAVQVTREQVSRLGSRFVYTNLLYRNIAEESSDVLDKEADHVIRLIDEHDAKLTSLLNNMEKELSQVKSELGAGHASMTSEQVNCLFKRTFEQLASLEKKYEELQKSKGEPPKGARDLEEQSANVNASDSTCMENESTDSDYFAMMVDEVRDPEQQASLVTDDSDPDKRVEDVLTEYAYQKLITKDSEGNKTLTQKDPAKDTRFLEHHYDESTDSEMENEGTIEELNRQIKKLQEKCNIMWKDLNDFPYRKREYRSPRMTPGLKCAFCSRIGEHFSDSCPYVTEGGERYEMIVDEGICRLCFKDCPLDEDCAYKNKPCYYCSRLKGTAFRSLMLRDEGHHTAICTVPDKKGQARRMVEEVKDELRSLKNKLHHAMKTNADHSKELQRQETKRKRAPTDEDGMRYGDKTSLGRSDDKVAMESCKPTTSRREG